MALSEFEANRCQFLAARFVARHRPPSHLRDEVDVAFRILDQSVELFEIRCCFDDPAARIELPFAKATYNKSKKHWRVYWRRADLKWHRYPPRPEVPTFEEFLALVEEDVHSCFRG